MSIKKCIACLCIASILFTHCMDLRFCAESSYEAVASYTRLEWAERIEKDPRFKTVYQLPLTTAADTYSFFNGGVNDYEHVDLSGYINKTTSGVVSFYVKASRTGSAKLRFFHTANAEYGNTNEVSFSVSSADKWILVNIPTDKFTYNGSDCLFARVDLLTANMHLGADDYFTVSPISVMTGKPEAYYEAESISIDRTETGIKIGEKFKLNIKFGSSKTDGNSQYVLPTDILWSSSNTAVASVDDNGCVLGLNEGKAEITATAPELSQSVSCGIVVSGKLTSETVAEYTNDNLAQDVTSDIRFNKLHTVPAGSNETAFYLNGLNDFNHQDLSGYINQTTSGVVSFYVKASRTGSAKLRFFHTANAEYRSTNEVSFSVSSADKWILVNIPTDRFTYNGSDCLFARVDLLTANMTLGTDDYFMISPIGVLTCEAPAFSEADGIEFCEAVVSVRVNEKKKLQLKYISSNENGNASTAPLEVVYKSSDDGVLTVDSSGCIIGKSQGTAKVTATSVDNSNIKAECSVTVSGEIPFETVASFTRKDWAVDIENDPRFGTVYRIPHSESNNAMLFANGQNDWSDAELSDYINKSTLGNIGFYVKSSKSGTFGLRFFHIRNQEYQSSNTVTVTIDKVNTWTKIHLPTDLFTYTGTDCCFARMDLLLTDLQLGDKDSFYVSAINVTTFAAPEVQAVIAKIKPDNLTLSVDETLQLKEAFEDENGNGLPSFDTVWESSDASVVTVDEQGVVKGISEGNAEIRLIRTVDYSVQAISRVTVSGALEVCELARFYAKDAAQEVKGDARFSEVYGFSGNTKTALYNNGTDVSGIHNDFTPYFGKNVSQSVSFYVKSPHVGEYKVCFFHTENGENKASTYQTFKIEKADTWQLIDLPLGGFDYNGTESKKFAEFNIFTDTQCFTEDERFYVSPIRVLSKAAVDLTAFDGEISGDTLLVGDVIGSAQESAVLLDNNGTPVEDGYIGTGMRLCVLENNSRTLYASFTVKNDLDGDGILTAGDLCVLRKYLLGEELFTDVQLHAISADGRINIISLVRLKKILSNLALVIDEHPGVPGFDTCYNYKVYLIGAEITDDYTLSCDVPDVILEASQITVPAHVKDDYESITVTASISESNRVSVSREIVFPRWEATMIDEFDGDKLNEDVWSHRSSWPGADTVRSNPNNAVVKDGILTLNGTDTPWEGAPYSDCYIHTKDKFTQTYGMFTSSIKVPEKGASITAFWMLPNYGDWGTEYLYRNIGKDSWVGEVDMLEYSPSWPAEYFQTTMHSWREDGTRGGEGKYIHHYDAEISSGFHEYTAVWTENAFYCYYDGILVLSHIGIEATGNPAYLILDLELGKPEDRDMTSWAGEFSLSDLPIQAQFDYVKVYTQIK